MTEAPREKLEPLGAPPIVEVACGFLFEPIPHIDPVSIGAFWYRIRDRFPERALRSAVVDRGGPILLGNVPPLRTWMISASGETLLQVQQDRLYFNWRSVGPEYPRFSSDGGVGSQALAAFRELCDYLDKTFEVQPEVRAVEVLKIDMLERGVHWQDHADAARMLPVLAAVLSGGPLEGPSLQLQLAGDRGGCALSLRVDLLSEAGSDAVRLETIARAAVDGVSVVDALSAANDRANELFGWLIPRGQRDIRFGRRDL